MKSLRPSVKRSAAIIVAALALASVGIAVRSSAALASTIVHKCTTVGTVGTISGVFCVDLVTTVNNFDEVFVGLQIEGYCQEQGAPSPVQCANIIVYGGTYDPMPLSLW
jgi:hypothetical protein